MYQSRYDFTAAMLLGTLYAAALPSGAVAEETATETGGAPYVLLNQKLIEGSWVEGIDLNDPDEVFWTIYSRLPDEVMIYPTENYYYWIMYINGKQIWGNIRLPAGARDRGVVSFGYFEFDEFPSPGGREGISGAKYFTDAHGMILTKIDDFTYKARYNKKEVIFHMYKLPQDPPRQFKLGENEKFIERTLDESGMHFFLIYNTERKYFFWVLNEEFPVPDTLEPEPLIKSNNVLIGKRSGFVFWVDAEHDDRKVMVAIRQLNSRRNDYYDGPFDQLADNYVDEVKISDYIQEAAPSLRGRIDKYGYYTDREKPMRVALSNYYTYYSKADLIKFVDKAFEADDPYQYISRRGIPEPTTQPAASQPTSLPAWYRRSYYQRAMQARARAAATQPSPAPTAEEPFEERGDE